MDEYVFQEYPKWVTVDGESFIVQDAKEEKKALKVGKPEVKDEPKAE